MIEWLRRFIATRPLSETDFSNEDHSSGANPQSHRPDAAAVAPSATAHRVATSWQKPRTLAAELENNHLARPLVFEPALQQYSAFRGGEPVFASEAEGDEWFKLRSRVLRHILKQISQSTVNEHLILRGSALMSIWFGQAARRPGDLDWVVTPDCWTVESREAKRLIGGIHECLMGTTDAVDVRFSIPDQKFVSEDIWIYEKAPGKRLIVPWRCENHRLNGTVQLDFVFGEVMPSRPASVSVGMAGETPLVVSSATPEQSLAWKLLWLETDTYGQGKDLYDAVLLAENCSLDAELLRRTFAAGHPLGAQSAGSLEGFDESATGSWHIEWDDFKTEYPEIPGTEHEWKERLAKALRPLFEQLAVSRP